MAGVPAESPFAFLTKGESRAWFAYMKVHLRLRYEMDQQLRHDFGLSLADYDVLVALTSDPDGAMTVSDLAARIGLERSRVSHQVQRMTARGVVDVAESARDRRATDVVLTDAGRATLARVSPSHIAFVRSVFLDALTPERQSVLAETLEDVYDALIAHGTLPRPIDHP